MFGHFVLAMVLLILAVSWHDLLIYLGATAAAGGAYSLLFVGGLQVISAAAPANHRGGILSALYLLGYLSMGALALLLGAIATMWGLSVAVYLGAATIFLINVATLVLALQALRRPGTQPATQRPGEVRANERGVRPRGRRRGTSEAADRLTDP